METHGDSRCGHARGTAARAQRYLLQRPAGSAVATGPACWSAPSRLDAIQVLDEQAQAGERGCFLGLDLRITRRPPRRGPAVRTAARPGRADLRLACGAAQQPARGKSHILAPGRFVGFEVVCLPDSPLSTQVQGDAHVPRQCNLGVARRFAAARRAMGAAAVMLTVVPAHGAGRRPDHRRRRLAPSTSTSPRPWLKTTSTTTGRRSRATSRPASGPQMSSSPRSRSRRATSMAARILPPGTRPWCRCSWAGPSSPTPASAPPRAASSACSPMASASTSTSTTRAMAVAIDAVGASSTARRSRRRGQYRL